MNEHNPPKERRMATTPELVAELATVFAETEASSRKLARVAAKVVKGVIANGDAASLGALGQLQLQHKTKMITNQIAYDIVTFHKHLIETAALAGIPDELPPPSGDDDIVVYSTGR